MQIRAVLAVLPVWLSVCAFSQAQPDRGELASRLREFEVAWDRPGVDTAAKKRALPTVNQAVMEFFRLNLSGAGKSLDDARMLLESADRPGESRRWAESLRIIPDTRLYDADVQKLEVVVKPFYSTGVKPPAEFTLTASVGGKELGKQKCAAVPATFAVPVGLIDGEKNRDFVLSIAVEIDGKRMATRTVGLSRVESMEKRVSAAVKSAEGTDKSTIERRTGSLIAGILGDLMAKKPPETTYPAARLLAELESLSIAKGPFYTAERSGEFWLQTNEGRNGTTCRIRVPAKLDPKKPIPVVVALHGMGGSENMFFDAYGDGIVRKKCDDRGWMMIATRSGGLLGTGATPGVTAVIDQLAERYPIDRKKVFLVGHSMGAGHTIQTAVQNGDRFAGMAALGGGGRSAKLDAAKNIPLFVGCGKADFAIGGAKTLHGAFEKAGGTSKLVEYDDIEHLTIVRAAADDLFAFFDRIAAGKP